MSASTSKRNIEAVYALSPMQQGMLFHGLYESESGVYVGQLNCTLRGDLDVAAFQRAWQRAVDRHPILRTAFAWKSLEKTLQVVYQRVVLPLEQQDWRGLPAAEQAARLEAFLQADRQRGFDLSRAPLVRLALMRTAEEAHEFVWSLHHILLDGWSLPLLMNEVLAFYEIFRRGQDLALEPPRPYRDYIAWLQQQDLGKAEAYWRRTLAGFTAPTPLVVDRPLERAAGQEARYAEEEMRLSAAATARLQSLARQHHLTTSTLVQGAWALLLSRYSGEEDVMFGATVAGRPADLAGVETMVGLFINTLPVRVRIAPQAQVAEWLKALQDQLAEMREYEYSPLVQVQEWSEIPRGTPLFESILVFENYPVAASLQDTRGSLTIENVRSIERTNYPLTVVSGPGKELPLKVSYNCQRFDTATIGRMLGHLGTLLEGMGTDPEQPIAALPLLTEAERQELLVEWNTTQADYPQDTTAHQLFEAQVERTPDHMAVTFEEEGLTYRELNRRANQLAHYLQRHGVGPETLAGICVERSLEMIVGVLGVLKAGGAYLPLDPSYPRERLALMLEDAEVRVLLTQESLLKGLPPHQAHTMCLDADWEPSTQAVPTAAVGSISQESDENPASEATADTLAYVIYTSGSTGQPKGSLLQHRGLCNLAHVLKRLFQIGASSRVLQFASFSFDASVTDIFSTLLAGATLVLARQETLASGPDLLRLLREQAITTVTLPPSLLAVLPAEGLPGLETVVSAGESCPLDIAARWGAGRRFLNGYGPTEATVGASFYQVEAIPAGVTTVPIGRPISNVRFYLLDRQQRPVPVGVPGELCIGGVGVGRGYLKRPELTAERFVPDPHPSPLPGRERGEERGRLYRTGDLARYLPDGNVEFLGRVDYQVKVRGFRIELGEIEATLSQHPAVQQAVVLAREDEAAGLAQAGEKRLVAYVVPRKDVTLDAVELRSFLKERLPAYMVPSATVTLEALPLLPNGKVDRRALPAPVGRPPEVGYVAPRTPVEEVLAELWARVLNVERIGVQDDFFESGGHSLRAMQLISRVREAFQVEVPLRDLFEAPTVEGLAARIETLLRAEAGLEAPPVVPVARQRLLPLSFAQQRLWFLDQLAPGNLFYNIPLAVRLRGRLDVEALERSLNEIVRRHEALRTTFKVVDGTPVQVIAPEWTPGTGRPLPVEDLRNLPEEEREAEALRRVREEAQQPFDLARGPLLRVRLLRLAEEEHIASLTMHHIVSDGWSMEVLVQELAALYEAFSQGRPSPLPALPVQYADFAHWQRAWLQGEVLEQQLGYWKERLRDRPLMLDLPTDRPRPAMQSWRGATGGFELPAELSKRLNAFSREGGATLFMTLLAAFQVLLYRYTGQEDISVGTAIANRNRAEIEGLIGFFVNTLVMRTNLAGTSGGSGAPSFREVLKRVREVALGAYTHQDLPFEMLVETLQPERDLSHTPLFQVAFALQNALKPLELPGLTLTPLEVDSGTAKFDLTLTMTEGAGGLNGAIEYNTDLFEAATIRRMVGHLQTLLEGIVADPNQPISGLPLLTEAEQRQLLVEWNNTAIVYPAERCAHELFEAQVARRPEAIAVTFEGASLTYRELDERANQLGHYLQKMGVGPEVLVGLSTDRAPEMVVGILGTLKAGGAYVPLDPSYPPERLAFMLEDAQVRVLLTQADLVERLPAHRARVVRLDAEWAATAQAVGISQEPTTKPASTTQPENVAYVIYTSGSTGKPKGTMLCHRGLCNLTGVQRRAFGIRGGSRVLQFSPLSFDASVWESFMALANGATLCLARQEVLASGQELVRLIGEDQVSNVTLPPSVLRVLPVAELPELRTVIAAGEACTPELVARWAPGRDFFNAYGPTETTVCASMYRCDGNDRQAPPIGRPISNTSLYVLDRHLQPVPVGVPGELHVGGVSLARGYLNRPELTAERFVPNPFRDEPGTRLYKTGDLVRYLADGNIAFLDRIDHQVKVRGFRIELGEIEAVLRQHTDVREGVVLARENGASDKRLVAYMVARDGAEPRAGELRQFLREQLPEYMVPSLFVTMEALPLTPSGKVDRRALPVPEGVRPDLEREYVAPRNETEETLAAMCAELLGVDRVGAYDNFFELGGHSLLATQFVSRLRDTLHVELPLRSLFESPTVAGLAERVEALSKTTHQDVDKIAQALERIGQLSEDELRMLLTEKKALIGGRMDNA